MVFCVNNKAFCQDFSLFFFELFLCQLTLEKVIIMPLKCYIKPDRKKKRVFMPCDVARIAEYCFDDNNQDIPRELILALVAKRLGFTHISLHRRDSKDGNALEPSKYSTLVKKLEDVRGVLNDLLRKFGIEG